MDVPLIINSKSVAIVGASGSPGKVGKMFMDRYIEAGFETIYPINPREEEILGLKAYASVADIPYPVDLVHILLPPKAVVPAINDCIKKGVKGIIVTSASFGLDGDDAKFKEQEIVRKAKEKNVRIIGPNCIGIYCPSSRLPFPLGQKIISGQIGIVTQSGSFADLLTKIATENGVYFSKAISCGNEADLNAVDFLEYLSKDEETKIILAYLEGTKDGRKFYRLAREITKTKPVIAWKCGSSEAGATAAASHTGAMAGDNNIWKGVFKGSGIISISSLEEALDCLYIFNCQPLPQGTKVGIVTGPGGPAVGAVDECIEFGLEVPRLSKETKEKIKNIIPPFGSSPENPVDLSIAAIEMPQMYGDVVKLLDKDDNVDMIVVIGLGGDVFCQTMIETAKDVQKPIAIAAISPMEVLACDFKSLLSNGIPVYPDPKRCINALSKFARYAKFRNAIPFRANPHRLL